MEKTENSHVTKAELTAVKYLSYRSRTSKEVRNKLSDCGEFDESVINDVLVKLEKRGYIDDERFAELFVLSKSRNKLDGRRKITQMLMRKGIDIKTIDAAFLALEDSGDLNEVDNAEKLIRKKMRKLDGCLDYKEKKKLFDFLARKGYSFSAIKTAFRNLGAELETEYLELD